MSSRVALRPLRSGLDADANRALCVAAVQQAADTGAELVVLPEYAARFDPKGVGLEHAEALDGPFVEALAAAAARTGTVVVAGTVVPGRDGRRALNVTVAVGPQGTLIGHYRKVHLYDAFGHRESDRFEPGPAEAEPLVVPVGDLRVGVMTCYDLRFPESARRLVDAGATALVVPAAWAVGEHKADQWRTLLQARAIESCAYVLGVPQVGDGVTGDCLAVDPLGVVVARSSDGPVRVELDADVVAQVRELNPSLHNRRYAVVPRDDRTVDDAGSARADS